MGLGLAAAVKEHIDAYRQTWRRSQNDAGRLNCHVTAPKLGVLRQVVVAETDDEALAITRAAHDGWYRSITKLWHDHDDHSVDGIFAWETAAQHETILSGSPRRVCDQLDRLVRTSDCNYVICAFAWGDMPHQQSLRSLRLFAQEIMPAFSESTAPGSVAITDQSVI